MRIPTACNGVGGGNVAGIGVGDVADHRAHSRAVRNREQERDLAGGVERLDGLAPGFADHDGRRSRVARGPAPRYRRQRDGGPAVDTHDGAVDVDPGALIEARHQPDRQGNRRPVLHVDHDDTPG